MKKCVLWSVVVSLLVASSSAGPARADVKLPKLIGSHMVLQRDRPLPIWGWAGPGEEVTVTLDETKASAKADAQGNWKVVLPAVKADGKAHRMIVSGKNKIELEDILIGEVWLGSGQSNMSFRLAWSGRAKDAIAAANCPQIRLLNVGKAQASQPARDIGIVVDGGGKGKKGQPAPAAHPGPAWKVCTPQTVPNFAAVLYYFGQRLNKELGVPVGLINSSKGGTSIESWSVAGPKGGGRYNGMIAPLAPFAIRGAIWYQGEANVGDGLKYADKMKTLIGGWRQVWGHDFPVYFVQLPPWSRYKSGSLPPLWEAQAASLKIPGTGMVVTSDLVDSIRNIHPKNKFDVGNRLALWALGKDYGKKDLVYSGPLYKSMKVEGNKIRLSFAHVGGGLNSRDGKPLSEFQIAGADGKFVPAEASIDGNTVVVQAKEVASPTQVRFGWRNVANPNLVNKEGLPASPFQTNNWQGGTGDPLPKAIGSQKAVDAKAADSPKIAYTGDGSDLQAVIDAAPIGATVTCDAKRSLEISKAITIHRALTLRGLHARLPKKLGRMPILVVAAEGVTLSDLELHGNYDSVSQKNRAPLIHVRKGRFTIERCVFYDASKDGVMVTPKKGDGDIVGVVVRHIKAYRMGRDAVSIAGGDRGQGTCIRNVLVEDVRLERGYLRGAVEVSDGTDNVTVRRVYAANAKYAIEQHDHGQKVPNTNVLIEDVTAVNCYAAMLGGDNKRGHKNLTLRRFTATNCKVAVQIKHIANVLIEDLTITNQTKADSPRIRLTDCQGVRLRNVKIKGLASGVKPVIAKGCSDVVVEKLTLTD